MSQLSEIWPIVRNQLSLEMKLPWSRQWRRAMHIADYIGVWRQRALAKQPIGLLFNLNYLATHSYVFYHTNSKNTELNMWLSNHLFLLSGIWAQVWNTYPPRELHLFLAPSNGLASVISALPSSISFIKLLHRLLSMFRLLLTSNLLHPTRPPPLLYLCHSRVT